jgi:hypothetical protein
MPPSLSWKFTEKEFTEQVKDVKLFVKCIQAITLNHPPLLCGFASLREISMSDFRTCSSILHLTQGREGAKRERKREPVAAEVVTAFHRFGEFSLQISHNDFA